MFCSKCGNKIEEGTKFCNKCGNKVENETVDKEKNKPYKIMLIIPVVVLCVLFITSILTLTNKKVNYKESNYNNSIDTNTTINVQYGDTNYENEIYGEKVVEAYVSKYGAIKNIGKLNSITKSEFLEKDNYGRYAFRVTFNYNPIKIDKAGTVFLNNQEAIKTVIAIYILNLDNPGGIYVGTENVIETDYAKWEQMKNYKNLCYGAWNTPLTIKFSD